MKLKTRNALMIVLVSMGLAACGGSIGGNTGVPDPAPIKGNHVELVNGTPINAVSLPASNDFNQITIDGRSFAIYPAGITSNRGIYSIIDSAKTLEVGGSSTYRYSRWGFYYDKATDKQYTFAQVQATASMPTTGTARYLGNAIEVHYLGANNTPRKHGTSDFNVDFGAKTITGRTQMASASPVALSGNITGNQFSGTHATSGYTMNGYFAGPNAAEIAGTYHKPNIIGTFGAVKQP